jgi:PAS domain S-box-containing protein
MRVRLPSAKRMSRRPRVQSDQQLRESLREIGDLKAALDEHAIVAMTDPGGRITYVNDKFCAISRYSREELLGQDHRIINSGHHPKEFIRELWHTIANGRVWHGEIKNRAKDGSFYWVDTTIVPFLNDQGKPRQYIAIRADITERKRAEEQLRESTKEVIDLKAALDEHAIVAITNPAGRITYVNEKFCAISKYSREELLGQDHRIINSGHHPKEFIRDLWREIAHGRVWHGEIKNRAKDGSFYWVDTTIVPFLDEHGKPRQYVAIRADITERKAAEDAVLKLNAELERRVAERTAELEAFSYSVSHDLRAPLRGIDGFARILQEDYRDRLDDEGRRVLGVVCSEAHRMGRLIDNLLDFSRLGRQQMENTEVDMTALARGVIDEQLRGGASHRPEVELHPLPLARGDRAMLRQVLVNLIGNAVKFTSRATAPRIKIGGSAGEGQSGYHITDNGAGFDEQFKDKLFRVFQRLHAEDEFEGTGVGLALVQRIIQRHGGRVWAEGRPGSGATFHFTLPAGASSNDDEQT